jgi:hypothetical protein
MRSQWQLFQQETLPQSNCSHCPGDGRLLDLSESPVRVRFAGYHYANDPSRQGSLALPDCGEALLARANSTRV